MTAQSAYFDLPEVSCSDLKALERAFYTKPDPFAGDREFARFGSLVDAMLTEPWRLKPPLYGLVLNNGTLVFFDAKVWAKAERMADLMRSDSLVAMVMQQGLPQYVFRVTLKFSYDDNEYEIRGRCMFDYIIRGKMGLDFKMLSVTSQKAFLEAIDFFDYDMQAAYYMDLAKIDRHVIACGSKPKEKVFKHVIERGDKLFESGRAKYQRWAFYWLTLIGGFLPQPYEIRTLSTSN